MKVMIVDDSKHILLLVEEMLVTQGHKVMKAENGAIARELAMQTPDIDLILLDWNMPEMDGPTFLEKNQQESFTKAAIIMMTTESGVEQITKAMSLGAREYIMKPFTQDILKSKISMIA